MKRPLDPESPALRKTIAAILGVACVIVYAMTAAPGLSFIDSGELATVAWTLGVAHPTGYPLFTLAGFLVAHAPAGHTPIGQLNLFSGVLCGVAVAAFFLLLVRFLREGSGASGTSRPSTSPASERRSREQGVVALAAAGAGALMLAFSSTWWSISTTVEVYPLHAVFLVLLTGLFFRAFPADRREGGGAAAHLFAFTLGLSFTNHMSTIYLAPAFLTLFGLRRGLGKGALTEIAAIAPAFLLGFSLNLYLPLRSSAGPLMNWGHPVDPEAFLRHLRGKQYGVWMFSSAETAAKQLGRFFSTVGPRFTWVPLGLAVWGMRDLFRRDRQLFLLLGLLFAGCLAFAVNYEIEDIESYFLLADIALAAAAAAGLRAIFLASRGTARTVAIGAAAAFLGVQAARTGPAVDQSSIRQVDQYARTMLASADSGAIILSYQWDYFVSASYYLQEVERFRPDVIVVDKELLRRSWYVADLDRRAPALLEGLQRETAAYLAELRKFEHDLPYDPRAIEGRYTALMAGMAGRHYADRAVYITADIEPQYTAGYRRIPHGLLLRLRREGDPDLWTEVPVIIDPPGRRERYLDAITMLAARAEVLCGDYARWNGDTDMARRAAERALAIRPDYADARRLRQSLDTGVPTNPQR